MSISHAPAEIEYPDSDGEPIAENTLQFRWIVTLHGGLTNLFHNRPDVFVAGDLLWYPVEGDNKYRMAPDAMVVIGRPKGDRGSYMQWREENIPPQVVFEVLSPGNRAGEMRSKRQFYEHHGVEEYYIYDPDRVTLEGYLRDGPKLKPIRAMDGWTSPLLGIRFDLSGAELRVLRPDGQPFATYQEVVDQSEIDRALAVRATERAERETERAERATERAEREAVRAQREAERAKQEAEHAERERERAERKAEHAERERERADREAEAKVSAVERAERLAAQLRALGIEPEA